MPPEPQRVLLCDATSYKAVVLATFLKRHHPGIELSTCDHRRGSRVFHTRVSDGHHVLACGPETPGPFVEALLRLVRDARVDLLLPVNSREMDALMPAKAEFGAALAYWGPLDAYLTLHRKDRLHALAHSLGIRVPARFATTDEIAPPAVAKPVARSAAKDVQYLEDRADVERFRARKDAAEFVVDEYVAGEGVGYSVFAKGGVVVAGYGHRRLAEFPTSGGSSVYREGWDDPRMRDVAERLVAATGWSGFAMFEWKRTPQDGLVLLEANPRLWGSVHQPLAAGVDLLEPLLGPARLPARPQVRTYFSPLVYASLLGYALRGRLGPALDFATSLGRNRADVALHRDPLAWLGAFLRLG